MTDVRDHDHFFMPAGYRANPVNETLDSVSKLRYWTPERVAASGRYQWAAYRYARTLADRAGARTVVDVGCGVATKLAALFGADFDIFGVDQPDAVEACRRLGRPGTYVAENFEDPELTVLDLVDGVDLLICSDVVEHLLDPDALMAYLRRLAGPGTIVVLTTPERDALHGRGNLRPSNPAHVREWTAWEFARYVERCSFRVDEQRVLFPFRPRLDGTTLRFVARQVLARHSLRTNQLVVCGVAE